MRFKIPRSWERLGAEGTLVRLVLHRIEDKTKLGPPRMKLSSTDYRSKPLPAYLIVSHPVVVQVTAGSKPLPTYLFVSHPVVVGYCWQ